MDSDPFLERFRMGEGEAVRAVSRLASAMVDEHGYSIPWRDREDVVQDILIGVHLFVSAQDFQLRRSFAALIRSIAHRRCVDRLRRREPLPAHTSNQTSPAVPADQVLIEREKRQRGRAALGRLGPSCRRLIHLRVGREMSYRDIAIELKRTELSVRVQFHKCLDRARQLLRTLNRDTRVTR